jgi:hypothetical protein
MKKKLILIALALTLTLAAVAKGSIPPWNCTTSDPACVCLRQCKEFFNYCISTCRYTPDCGTYTCSNELCDCLVYTCGFTPQEATCQGWPWS